MRCQFDKDTAIRLPPWPRLRWRSAPARACCGQNNRRRTTGPPSTPTSHRRINGDVRMSGAHLAEGVDKLLLQRRHLRAVERILTGSMRWLTPRRVSVASASLSAAVSPDSTTLSRRIDRADAEPVAVRRDKRCGFRLAHATDAMRPSPVACCMMRPRCQTIRTASSRSRAPATCSAAISPTLWPTTASGVTPQDFHSAASATWMREQGRLGDLGLPETRALLRRFSSSSSDQPASGRSNASQASMVARKTGSRRQSSRPIAYHCGPCPLKTNASWAASSLPAVRRLWRRLPLRSGNPSADCAIRLSNVPPPRAGACNAYDVVSR